MVITETLHQVQANLSLNESRHNETIEIPSQSSPEVTTRPRRRALRVVGAFAAAATLYGALHHEQVSLAAQLAVSDINSEFASPPDPVLADSSENGVIAEYDNAVQSNYAGNGLYKEGLFYGSFYTHTVIDSSQYLASLLPSSQSSNYYKQFEGTLVGADAYLEKGSKGYPEAFSPGLSAFTTSEGNLNDDNEWQDQNFIRAGSAESMKAGERLLTSLVTSQWDKNGGGVYWQEQTAGASNERAIVSNAPAAQELAEYYMKYGKLNDLKLAEKIYSWAANTLLDKSTGLYYDDIEGKTINTAIWTYTQGAMIGAGTALHNALPSKYPLVDQVDLAERSMKDFSENNDYGDSAFDLVFFENVLNLAYQYNNAQFTAEVKQALNQAIKAKPKPINGALQLAGDFGLKVLQSLPFNQYGHIFYGGHPYRVPPTTT